MKIFLELKSLKKNTQKTLNLSFQQLSLHANVNFCWVPSDKLCINTPHDTICLPADRILRCFHSQNLEKQTIVQIILGQSLAQIQNLFCLKLLHYMKWLCMEGITPEITQMTKKKKK